MFRERMLKAMMIFLSIALATSPFDRKATAGERVVLATTFPIYQIVRNVTQGRDAVRVELLLPSQMGCPHDYALTPQDMQKLARAEILVMNGLGMEEFLGAPVKQANPTLITIDSSFGIQEILPYEDGHEDGHSGENAEPTQGTHGGPLDRGSDQDHEDRASSHGHHHFGVNPHLFVSPRMNARLAMNIAASLARADPNGAKIYLKNGRAYADSMDRLADDMASLGKRLRNNRIVQPHGVFDYLARDMGLEIVATMLPHGREPSASRMLRLVKTVRETRPGVIVTEPQYSDKIAKTLSKETGLPVVMLDPTASGPEDAPLGYYETIMRQNMKILETAVGVK